MTQLRDAIAALAQRIEEQWKNHCYDYAAFPEIACAEIRALGDLSIFGEQSLWRSTVSGNTFHSPQTGRMRSL